MFDALDDCLDPALRMPVRGVEVVVPFPTVRRGLRIKRWYAAFTSGQEVDPFDPVAEFIPNPPDGLDEAEVSRCAWTALAYFGAGPKAMDTVWRGVAPEKKPEPPALVDGPYGPYDPRPGAYGPNDPGGGPPDPETGIRRWYNADAAPDRPGLSIRWVDILDRWNAIVCDFQQHYHLDLDALLDDRHIGWLEARITGLQEIPGSRVQTIAALSKET